jgi:hypothetical protein
MSTDDNNLAYRISKVPGVQNADRVVAAVVAEGWRPPPRVIETIEQLDDLPIGSVIRELVNDIDDERFPTIRLKTAEPNATGASRQHVRETPGSNRYWPSFAVDLPAVLLSTPGGDS